MIEEYYKFDAKKLLKDMPMHQIKITSLKDQLENMDGVGGTDNAERVGGTKPVDGVEQLVIRRMRLELQIKNLEEDVKLVDKLFLKLPQDEQTAIKECLWKDPLSKSPTMKNLMEKMHIEKTAAYDLLDRAVARFSSFING